MMRSFSFYLFFYLSSISLVLSIPSDSSDLNVLMKLKTALVGTKGSGLHDWKESLTPGSHCSFSGVLCDTDYRVTSLEISGIPLFGTISPEIGLLDKLVNLTIANSSITGKLPSEIANLKYLKLFNVSNNNLTGEFPELIAGGLPEAEIFDIYNNNFSGPLPVEVVKLKRLKHLHLGGNFFNGEIPENFSEIQSLEYLGLNGNGLSGRIPASLAKLSNLQEMYIGYFNSYEGGVPPEFGSLSLLRKLDLGSCNLSGEIPASLGNLKLLDTLFLQFNRFIGQIPAELSGCVSLKSLDLSINELTGEIPDGFSNLKQLTLLHLFRNHLHGRIPLFIGDLPYLEVLGLWENNFTYGLPENLGRNGRLQKLDVATNHLTGTIPRDLCAGNRLMTLILMENYFFGPIPEELGACKSLTRIRLMKNFLNGTIPPGLFNLPSVDMLELNDNYFTGKLPSVFSGNALGLLAVSNNWITGQIPAAIGNLPNLQTLSLEMNRFSGVLPPEIFELKILAKVNVSNNNISGQIPTNLAHCKSLTSIDLSRNNLDGEIPRKIVNLWILNTLNLSRNQLNGPVPSEIGSMTSLTTLDLSYNDFSGMLPVEGQFYVFNDSSFTGNPYLCSPLHHLPCLPVQYPANGPNDKSSSINSRKLITVIVLLICFLALLLFAYIRIKRGWKNHRKSRAWKLTLFQKLDFTADNVVECLKAENIIGKGGAGTVYRGSMPDGIDVAIKRLVGISSGRSDHGFSAEIQTLGSIRHRNIVRLLGYVSNKDTNLLLYEYMPNGSLGVLLHGSKGSHLQWEIRCKIAVEAAKGLCYLHHDCSPLIIHRDVKSNNILLDSDFEAHVADFGLAKFLQDAGASVCMSSIAGSYGYIAPEYAYTLRVDQKTDVYSFGVVLLELITGRKPVGEFGDGVDIVRWVEKTISEISEPTDAAAVLAVVDPRLNGYPLAGVINMFKVARLCVQDKSHERPSMREVVHMLTNPPFSPKLPSL